MDYSIKIENANGIIKCRQIPKISNLFRFFEVCVFLVLVSRFSGQLPAAFKNSGEYLQDLPSIMLSPRFVFIVGNAIIIALFAKSGQFSSKNSSRNNSGTDFYDENLKKSEKIQIVRPHEIEHNERPSTCETNLIAVKTSTYRDVKNFRRIQSVNSIRNCEKSCRELRRSETEKCRSSCCRKDEMSIEEFRRTIEAFIARQQRLRREEEYYTL